MWQKGIWRILGKNPNWEVSGVKHHVMQKISVDLSLSQVYRARTAARGLITGNEESQYGLLRDYAEMILRTDVGSRVILQTEMENENAKPNFKRMYIRYNAQKVSFLGGCRPFVGLDGCHLKGRFGGQLLSAIAKDGNDNIFPVAMAVVEQEIKDSWMWILEQFADDIGRPEELNLVFISDRQKGLLPAMKTLFSTVEHRRFVYKIDNERERHVVDLKPEDYTHPCYYKDAYVETYKTPIPPMPGQSEWMSSGQPKPVAPIVYKPPGRLTMKRKRDADEPNPYKVSRVNRPLRCGKCHQEGYNARECKANVTGETAWERRQRLQKGKSGSGRPSTHRQGSQAPSSS
ncbi:uncharacterized protein LOC112006306 [Quercus suber]|uniref:uncharacterized protein LOC112006306 n=1 Tax=Quercus suber TaxID=58331 RepID=UPI000CE1916E|nr:uncharacterized protein LOC112006306 [Quercus suber]